FAADPGGLPLYDDGTVVGGIGVEFDGDYTVDRDISDDDDDAEEAIAGFGARSFGAPTNRRA
ncbi:MAG: heme-binding protein, partial [Actinobacteria bacterium]|nr:heme-binding protein [Actinomycetota bacterium]NIU67300.1 heme-binding protein [Actinomycetota bacterium]NIW29085.1 hypothetical protein [Actinomycetota bacterium]